MNNEENTIILFLKLNQFFKNLQKKLIKFSL